MSLEPAQLPELLGLTALAALSVGLWTVRVAVTAAGRRIAAAGVAGVESLVFVLAMGTVLPSLGDPLRLSAYGLGVAGGTLVGLLADQRLSTGQSLVQVIVDGDGEDATVYLRRRGWPATCSRADGVHGAIAVLNVAVADRALRQLTADLDSVLPGAYRTVERLREVHPAHAPKQRRHASSRTAGRRPRGAGGHRVVRLRDTLGVGRG